MQTQESSRSSQKRWSLAISRHVLHQVHDAVAADVWSLLDRVHNHTAAAIARPESEELASRAVRRCHELLEESAGGAPAATTRTARTDPPGRSRGHACCWGAGSSSRERVPQSRDPSPFLFFRQGAFAGAGLPCPRGCLSAEPGPRSQGLPKAERSGPLTVGERERYAAPWRGL